MNKISYMSYNLVLKTLSSSSLLSCTSTVWFNLSISNTNCLFSYTKVY